MEEVEWSRRGGDGREEGIGVETPTG
jgi:hypothetical protein